MKIIGRILLTIVFIVIVGIIGIILGATAYGIGKEMGSSIWMGILVLGALFIFFMSKSRY